MGDPVDIFDRGEYALLLLGSNLPSRGRGGVNGRRRICGYRCCAATTLVSAGNLCAAVVVLMGWRVSNLVRDLIKRVSDNLQTCSTICADT